MTSSIGGCEGAAGQWRWLAQVGDRVRTGASVGKDGVHVETIRTPQAFGPGLGKREFTGAVADGLGHGPDAEGAGRAAIDHVLTHANRDMESIFAGLHRELRGTRGAAVTLVRLSFAERTLTHAGVGNVEAHLFPNSRATLISRPGVLGSGTAPNLRITTTAWPERGTLVVHSDGISWRACHVEGAGLLERHASMLCHSVMRCGIRGNDDATAVVIRDAR